MEQDHKSKDDAIKRFVEKDTGSEELSPMDPPDAFDPLNIESIPYENMHPFLQNLVDEHKAFTEVLNKFEEALFKWKNNNWVFNDEINVGLKQFFTFFDEKVPVHNSKEEKKLFPLLHTKLIETGEHNSEDPSITGINVMEDEHIKVAQVTAIVFNFLGLAARLPDQQSREITYQSVFNQGMAIVETMKLHIFREENILFPQAMQYFNEQEFNKMID
ncbi:MAG: hemerythrin domain-containing protein [Ignavibacteriaceae bacterium]|jgi:hemerythrin-like domain-containing protein|nr:hemerythrin domain-containing protein [Ignavibacteriaceae bacterium]